MYVGWLAFWVYWFISAARTKPVASRSKSGVKMRFGIFILLIFILRLSYPAISTTGSRIPANVSHLIIPISLILFFGGLSLAVWARIFIGKNWGFPMSQNTSPELVTSGPYAYVRHPIYSGVLMATLATAIVSGPFWLLILFVLSVYFIYSAKQEEKYLLKTFPKAYPKYKHTTKMLIPLFF